MNLIKLIFMPFAFLILFAGQAKAHQTFHYQKVAPQFSIDTSLKVVVANSLRQINTIPAQTGIDSYYAHLMIFLYQGANAVIKIQTEKIGNKGILVQAALFTRFHSQMQNQLLPFLKEKNKAKPPGAAFLSAVKASLAHFDQINYQQSPEPEKLTAILLVEIYENMDQISAAYANLSQNEPLKAISWDIVRKNNGLIDLLKPASR
ncbi:hypothetical protein [Mucilaginibacter sp.]|uniref:hypothetical protein n=1 Tax=Mucilaginibacter sp. TaxID=1882438 RepID=UPI000CAB4F2F|nr:hypothetical protein [Mucilaginibacter sp.]PLW88727.1 MAG: hypothetical protein C0154_15085 [Mucilaginibacter sp.]PMP65676.1 MAG: hypothetical protein C0191_02905 [Mucilaginibacter sp.]HEK18964.1 hypothetical protein [Bacteroidota bacterium]